MGDLEVATTKQLVDELKKRFPGVMVLAESEPDRENRLGVFYIFMKGGLSLRFGMLDRARMELAAEAAHCDDIPDDPEPEEDKE